ncbi:F-box/kelch-repeat protein At3g23880 [Solanum pennellii]|uniref:F-box/kelch-repeat protein At3g23880 n=1 Tax=Solanum pennellii TaxID=28526 RepID=A0ABM1G1R5_SOLPN|nr:F-box/kelch-repeat protein At3g23880 [Solanum pennellii]
MDGRSKIPYLPADIINSILLQLPVKSLSRFKSCCKSWHYCIDDADFIKSHLRNSSVDISRQKFVLVHLKPSPSTYNFEIVSTEASINADSKVVYLNIPEFLINYIFLQVFSCSGLVFMTSYIPGYSMILFNPALGKYKLIPNSLFSRKKRSRCSDTSPIFGFAYDFVADDYKVICAYYLINVYCNVVELYSVKNQCWRTIQNTFPVSPDSYYQYLHSNQVSLNSVIHRMSHNREVISFHLVDEKFTVTAVPKACGEQPTLHALGDGMCVFTTVGEESLIWSLEKDRWNCINKFHTLPSLIGMPIWPDVKPYTVGLFLFVKENGNILWRNHDGPFIEYHVRKNEYTEFKSIQIPPLVSSKALYVESLVSLKIPWD